MTCPIVCAKMGIVRNYTYPFTVFVSGYFYTQKLRINDMLKTCIYCGHIHDKKYICKEQQEQLRRKKPQTQITKFRSGVHWQKVRKAILIRDRYLCRVCLSEGVYTSGDLEVHHITPLSVDFSLRCDPYNLITLCPADHERAERGDIPAEKLRELIHDDTPAHDLIN